YCGADLVLSRDQRHVHLIQMVRDRAKVPNTDECRIVAAILSLPVPRSLLDVCELVAGGLVVTLQDTACQISEDLWHPCFARIRSKGRNAFEVCRCSGVVRDEVYYLEDL